MIVTKASNATEATSSKTIGLLETTLANNGIGNVVTEGLLAGLDTTGATNAGDPVWLGTSGNLIYGLANKPYAPAHLVFIGIVTRINANNGEIFVKVQNGFELKEIHDVDLITTTPVNGHILGYNGTLWVNKTIAGWLGFTPANAATYVPYTGATTSLDLGGNGLTAGAGTFGGVVTINATGNQARALYMVTGTAGSHYGSGTGVNLFSELTNNLSILFTTASTTKKVILNGANITTAKTYTLPDADGTLALTSQLSSYVPTSRTLTINGVAYDLSADRSWTVSSMIYPGAGIAVSTGTAWGTSITDNSANWDTAYTNRITSLTVTGSSGAATLVSNVLNIPTYTLTGLGGVATTRTLTINGTAYDLSADRSWTIDSTTAATRTIQKFTATAGQNSFTITGGYTVGMVDVYMNGVKLDNATDFTAVNGTTIGLTTGALLNSVIEVYKFGSQFIPNNALRVVTTFTATAGQSAFTVNYSVGLIDVFYNGSCLAQSEYIAINGTSVTLVTACQVNDIVVVYAYSYSVGAYSGIGGSGTSGQVPYFTSSAAIASSPNLFWDATNNRLGIGTSSPTGQFQVQATNSGIIFDTATAYTPRIKAAGALSDLQIESVGNGGNLILSAPGTTSIMTMSTNGAERMRITSAGQVYVANTGGLNGMLNSTTTDGNFALTLFDAFGNNALAGFRNSSAAQIGSITIVSGGSTTSYNTTSDYRLKEDLKDFNGLEKVSAIKVYDFKWKSGDYRMDGVIAHELAEVIPYAVVGEKDAEEMQSVDYSKLTPILVKAIQEMNTKIIELEKIVATK
jgi:hypothetical protein